MKGPPKGSGQSAFDAAKLDPSSAKSKDKSLPVGYVPGDGDVICGRGKECIDHIGNIKFRALVEGKLDRYASATNKNEKSVIIMETVNEVRGNRNFGGFVRKDLLTGSFFEAGDFVAREKTSQAFRDALSDRYKSSKATRKRKRTEDKQMQHPLVQTTNFQSLSAIPLASDNSQLRLPTAPRPAFYPCTSPASLSIPSNSQNMMFSRGPPSAQWLSPVTNPSQTDSFAVLMKAEQSAMSSGIPQNFNLMLNDQDMQRRGMGDNVASMGDLHCGLINPRDGPLSHSSLAAYHSTILRSSTQPHMVFNPHILSFPTTNENTNNLDSLRTFPEFSNFDLSTLEPTPIAENDSKQQPSPDDVKPPAKKKGN